MVDTRRILRGRALLCRRGYWLILWVYVQLEGFEVGLTWGSLSTGQLLVCFVCFCCRHVRSCQVVIILSCTSSMIWTHKQLYFANVYLTLLLRAGLCCVVVRLHPFHSKCRLILNLSISLILSIFSDIIIEYTLFTCVGRHVARVMLDAL